MSRYFLFFICVLSLSVRSQDDEKAPAKFCNEDINKKALALYEKALDRKKYKKPERLEFLSKALELEPDFAEANLRVGLEMIVRLKLDGKSFSPVVPFFKKAISACPQIHSEAYYYLGHHYYEHEPNNDSAKKYLQKFLAFKDDDDGKFGREYQTELSNAKGMLGQIKKDESLRKNVPFDPKVVHGISTERDEYLTYVSPDDKKSFFVRRVQRKNLNQVYESDKEKEVFMVAERDKTGAWTKGEPMPEPFNTTDDNQGGCSISIDNKHLYFAMMKYEGGEQPNVDLYISDFNGEYWSDIRKLSPNVNHPKYWDSQPSIASDGVTLYFASDRPGGYGGIDLYVTHKDLRTGQWSIPQNLGPKINTRGDEKTPFIHSDSETLYFCSTGHPGFGGYDIYFVRKDEKGEWTEPENIGSPINGPGDDTGFFVSSDTKTGYFFSYDEGKVRGRGVGRYDMYSFELYPEARPHEIAFQSGEIKDKEGNPVTGAVVEIKNVETRQKTHAVVDSSTGRWVAAINLKKKGKLVITVKKDSVAFNSTAIDTKTLAYNKPSSEIKLTVTKAEKGRSFVINNIYYKTNSAEVTEDSKLVLQSFADYLNDNPKLKVEIQGHTDNVGNPKDNLALSTNRAFSVKQLLESYKVDGKRIEAKGYGQEKPIADNKTEDGRARNRRTEFLILDQ